MVSFTQEHNSVCSQKQLSDIVAEQPLFVGSYLQVGVRPYGRGFLLFTNAAAILATLKQVWLDGGSGHYLFWYIRW